MVMSALSYIKETLQNNGGEYSTHASQSFRKRSEHCWRVFKWCQRIVDHEFELKVNTKVLYMSAIFHDSGYNVLGKPHELLGNSVFLDYLVKHPGMLSLEEIDEIFENILNHSDKMQMQWSNIPLERLIMMEADLLDEEGAMGIVIDCLTAGFEMGRNISYPDIITQLKQFASEILSFSPMRTAYSKEIWKKKQQFVLDFVSTLEMDCFFDE